MSLALSLKRAFRKLTPAEVAAIELADAELAKLQAQTAMEFAASVVDYNSTRIKRLKTFLAKGEKND